MMSDEGRAHRALAQPRSVKAAIVLALGLTFACTASAGTAAQPIGHYLFSSRGLSVLHFGRRGATWGYDDGAVIQHFHSFDPIVGHTVAQEVKLQLDQMRAMGVNEISFQLRSADPVAASDFTPPECYQQSTQGPQWPQPTPTELANLGDFFELVHNEGMKVVLELIYTHMEEQPPTNAQRWLGSILNVVKDKPALDLVQFDGTPHLLDMDGDGVYETCGVPAEAPLELGPRSVVAEYVRWAIGYGLSVGIPASKLTAEAMVGWDFWDSHQPTAILPAPTDGHWWSPIETMKAVFDQLGIAASERTYSLSFYEHRRCTPAYSASPHCIDDRAHAWADQSLRRVREVIGPEPRVFAAEFGDLPPVDRSWPTRTALESLSVLMQRYGIDGGAYWQWVEGTDAADHDPLSTETVKRRGTAFVFNPVRLELLDMYGFHLTAIPNGSFEARKSDRRPDAWTIAGKGTAALVPFNDAAAQPWRGRRVLRLTSSSGISATSAPIRVSPNTTYTTTADFRTRTGSSSVSFYFLTCSRHRSAVRARKTFLLLPSLGFNAQPFRYTTPSDACSVRVEIEAQSGSVEVDNVH
jgi:hypothetical protein